MQNVVQKLYTTFGTNHFLIKHLTLTCKNSTPQCEGNILPRCERPLEPLVLERMAQSIYESTAITSDALSAMYSEPSAPLNSLPAYLEYRTVFPVDTDSGFRFPSSSSGPGPTAIT